MLCNIPRMQLHLLYPSGGSFQEMNNYDIVSVSKVYSKNGMDI